MSLTKYIKSSAIRTIDEDEEVDDFSEDSDAEVQVSCILVLYNIFILYIQYLKFLLLLLIFLYSQLLYSITYTF